MKEELLKILVIFGIYFFTARWLWKKKTNPLDGVFDRHKDRMD